jgi:hypothetical protein
MACDYAERSRPPARPAARFRRTVGITEKSAQEAELYLIRQRMLSGKLAKAERGELAVPLPIGYVRRPSGEAALDPDEQAQHVVRLVFAASRRLGTVNGVQLGGGGVLGGAEVAAGAGHPMRALPGPGPLTRCFTSRMPPEPPNYANAGQTISALPGCAAGR